MNDTEHRHPDDEQLRAGLHRIADWTEPGAAPELAGTAPDGATEYRSVTRRPGVWAAAAASLLLIVLGAVWVLDDDDGPIVAGPEPVEEPSLAGVIERLPDGLEQVELVDVAALRDAAATTDDPQRREKVVLLLGSEDLRTNGGLVPFHPSSDEAVIDSGRIVAAASSGGAGWTARTLATTQPPEDLAEGLREVGFLEASPDRYERATPDDHEGPDQGTTTVILEPGYVDLYTARSPSTPAPPANPGSLSHDSPLRALIDAAGPFEAFSAVDTTGSGCGSAEALTYGPSGYSWLMVDPRGQLDGWTPDPTDDAEVVGRFLDGAVGPGRSAEGVTRFDIQPGPMGVTSDFPLGILTLDLPPVRC